MSANRSPGPAGAIGTSPHPERACHLAPMRIEEQPARRARRSQNRLVPSSTSHEILGVTDQRTLVASAGNLVHTCKEGPNCRVYHGFDSCLAFSIARQPNRADN